MTGTNTRKALLVILTLVTMVVALSLVFSATAFAITEKDQYNQTIKNVADYDKEKLASASSVSTSEMEVGSSAANAASLPAPPSQYTQSGKIISNSYLKYCFNGSDMSMWTTGGVPGNSYDDNTHMLFGGFGDGTSETYISINDIVYIYQASNMRINSDASSIYSSQIFDNDILVEQIVSFVLNSDTGRNDTIEIKYIMTNLGTSSKDVGMRIMLDTMVGDNDYAPFRIMGNDVTYEREYIGDAIPQTWKAFQNLSSNNIVTSGTFYTKISERPDKVQFVGWPKAHNAIFNVSVETSKSIGDSSVNAYFYPKALQPNESRVAKTYYGISDFDPVVEGDLTLSAIAPATLDIDAQNNTYAGNPFTFNTWVKNDTLSTATNVKLTLVLPSELSVVNQNTTVNIGSMTSGAEKNVVWYITATPLCYQKTVNYKVILSADGIDDIVGEYSITLPQISTIHTPGSWIIDTSAGCETNGSMHTECLVCGATVNSSSISATGHNYQEIEKVDATCTTDGYILYKCQNSGCGATKRQVIIAYGHDFGTNNICKRCGYNRNPHAHTYTTSVVNPTCSTVGYTVYTCSCGYSYRDDFVDQLGHFLDDGTILQANTCTEAGVIRYYCTRGNCTAYFDYAIPAAHDWIETIDPPSCRLEGSITRVCRRCNEREIEVLPPLHTKGEGQVILAPTCTEDGITKYECVLCDISWEETVDKLGHYYVDGVCRRCGSGLIINPHNEHPEYGMYFEIDDIISKYGPDYINEYGVLLDYNEDANIQKVGVYLTQVGTMWRRCIACVGENITYATYVPYLSYEEDIKYTGLNSSSINTFTLRENSDNIWCYSNYATIGVNLEDKYGNLLLSVYDIGQAGEKTRIFTDLDEMIAWLKEGQTKVVTEEKTACVGQTVTVNVSLVDAEPIKSMLIVPDYDEDVLELVSGEWLVRGTMSAGWDPIENNAVITFNNPTDKNGDIFELTFVVKDNVPFGTVANVSCDVIIKTTNGTSPVEYEVAATIVDGSITVGHDYSDIWSNDETNHWIECTQCGDKKNLLPHDYNSDCDSSCDTCGYERVAPHNWMTAFSYDNYSHWISCSSCNATKDESTHSYDDVCDAACNCGYVRVAPHSWNTVWSNDEISHWHNCTNCGNRKDENDHTWNDGVFQITDIDAGLGVKVYTCDICQRTKEEEVTVYKLDIGNAIAYRNRTAVTVEIYANNVEDVKSLMISDFSYNTNVLNLVDGGWNINGVIKEWNQDNCDAIITFANNVDLNGSILTLVFEVNPNAPAGDYNIYCDVIATRATNNGEEYIYIVALPGTVTYCPYIRGDVNGDGVVDSNDAIYLLRYSLSPASYPLTQSGDMDGNGYVNSDDAIYLLRHTLAASSYPLY